MKARPSRSSDTYYLGSPICPGISGPAGFGCRPSRKRPPRIGPLPKAKRKSYSPSWFPTPHLSLVDITVRRNAFGRQRESFVTDLDVVGLEGEPLRAVFIRAPIIERMGQGIDVLATVDGKIVLAESDRALVAAFHPELTADDRLHKRFLEKTTAAELAG